MKLVSQRGRMDPVCFSRLAVQGVGNGGKQGVFRNVSHFKQGYQRHGSRDFKEPRKLVIRTFGRRALWEEGAVCDDLEEHSGGNSGDGQPKYKRVERFAGQ